VKTTLLLPVDKIAGWTKPFPDINTLYFQQKDLRYSELLDTINHVLFDKIDKRLYDYLAEKYRLTTIDPIKILHNQIANELGTAWEVIRRVMKKP
jgi:CRP/FNR family transcriptional regulator